MFWGFSPALDLQDEYFSENKTEGLDEINILLLGGCDARHILKTLAQSYRHRKTFINIHVIEGCSELIVRQLMLISIAFEQEKVLGLLEKSRLFMEIYGNTLIRRQTSNYMISKAKQLIKMITNEDYIKKIMPFVSIERVKYRERDYIEMLLKYWEIGNSNDFDVCKLWDNRIRASLGARYDSRVGVFDWDYNMRLKEIDGSTVASQEFKHFRSTGVSFTWLETEVCRPNYTLVAGVITNGNGFIHRGYIGDIVTGPYIAYGLSCEDSDMTKSNNGVNLKRATDISERNVIRMFHEILAGNTFDPMAMRGNTEHNLGAVTICPLDAKLSEEFHTRNVCYNTNNLPCTNIDYAKIYFHSFSDLNIIPSKSDFQNKFDVLFIGNSIFSHVNPTVMNMIKNNGLVFIEGRKFFLNERKDNIKIFSKTIQDFAQLNKCQFVREFIPLEDAFAKMIVKRHKDNEHI